VSGLRGDTLHQHQGAWAEVVAVAWLLRKGWHVFPSATPTGPIDIVAVTPSGETLFIDVKTHGGSKSKWVSIPRRNARQVALGVALLLVNPETAAMRLIHHGELVERELAQDPASEPTP
jgi:Holliday junction resolvase-like predicted endonuclease